MKELKAPELETQKMTRDGAVSVNMVTGEATSISDRAAEADYSASSDTAGLAGSMVQRLDDSHIRKSEKKKRQQRHKTFREGKAANSRPSSRLQFSEEEQSTPELQKSIYKSNRAADRLDAAKAAVPKKRVLTKERVFDEASGKGKSKLTFTETDKTASFKQHANPLSRPLQEAGAALHGKVREVEQDNSGVQAGHLGERGIEKVTGWTKRKAQSTYRNHQLKPWRTAANAEQAMVKANADFLYQKALLENPGLASSNPISRLWQKKRLQRQYAAAYRAAGNTAKGAKAAAETAAKTAKKTAEETGKAASLVARHWKGALIVGGILLILLMLIGGLQSCSSIFGGGISNIVASSYLSEDADLLAAEAAYCAKEDELRDYLDTYEVTHSYDEYHFDLDDIEHDPYVLLSILSALHEGIFTIDEVQGDLQMLFEKQYILTETVVTERRYYIETDTWTETDPETGETTTYSESYRVYYDYFICTVTLENFNLSHVPVYIMGEDTLSLYATYMSTLGNRADLFPTSGYVSKYITNPPTAYDIPAEYLTDERFATLITEAEKYLGYPYVWGGSSPSTSFDCSGFVSWALTDSGLCNTGRLGAQGLYNICTPVFSPQPGDLVFFVGTYDTPGVSHVGIYVGDSMMLHCGDPINYTSLNSSYWQSHFYAYGRPPYN